MEVYEVAFVSVVGIFLTWLFVKAKSEGRYTNLKWLCCMVYLKLFYKRPKRLKDEGCNLTTGQEIGSIPTDVEEKFENPRQDIFDAVNFSGSDDAGNSITFHITKCPHRRATVWLLLNVKGRGVYHLPMYPETNVYNTDGKTFTAAGLKCEVLEPMRRWRISFNGLMKKDSTTIPDEQELNYVRFVFIWTAITNPYNYNEDTSNALLADMLAREYFCKDTFKKLRSLDTFSQYDQWGQLYGKLSIDDEKEITMHLRGLRMRSFGTLRDEKQRHIDIQVALQEGTQIHIACVGPINGLKRLQYGCVFGSSGTKCPITWTDLSLNSTKSKITSVSFKYRETIQTLTFEQTNVESQFYVGKEREGRWTVQVIKFKLENKAEGWGFVTLSQMPFQRMNQLPTPSLHSMCLPQLKPEDLPVRCTDEQLVVDLLSPYAASIKHSGGKGVSLALLHRLKDKFVVPTAAIITSVAFFKHIEGFEDIPYFLKEMEDVAWKRKEGNLQDACQKLTETIEKTSLSQKLKEIIQMKLISAVGDNYESVKFAVRSSAIGEDSEDLSAAGQNETFLGVSSLDNICQAVIKCWSSQFTFMAIEYKRQHGQLLNPGMAVVIQKMIAADSSAVMFTRDPNTGNPAKMLITANYGLGESVVAASAEPDTIILSRTFDDQLNISEKILGSKTTQTVVKNEGGTTTTSTKLESVTKFALSDEICLELGRIGILVEKSFGSPRDIECCVVANQIFLLQARPITSFDQPSEFELMHEFDSPVKTDWEYFTKANTGEVFPNATTPLGISVSVKLLDLAIQYYVNHRQSLGHFVNNRYCRYVNFTAYNHVFLNCIDLLLTDSGGDYNNAYKVLEIAVYGHLLGHDKMYEIAGERFRWEGLSRPRFTYVILSELLRNNSTLRKMNQRIENFNIAIDTSSVLTLYESIQEVFPLLVDSCQYHCAITSASTFCNLVAILILTEGKIEWNESLYADIAVLLGSCPAVESSDVPLAMKEVAKNILETEGSQEFFVEKSTNEATLWLQNNSGKAGVKFRELLEKHGHRCIKEFDLHSLTWKMDPSGLVQILQNMVKNPSQLSRTEHEVNGTPSIDDTVKKLKTPKKFLTRKLLSLMLSKYRSSVSIREASKSNIIRVINKLRMYYHMLADMMVREGFLPDRELLFYLAHAEIKDVLTSRSAKLVKRATLRKRLHNSLENLRFPEIIIGLPKPIQEEEAEDVEVSSTLSLSGTPVCLGTVKGTARVVTQLDKANEIQANDILITYSTDIGWSPYFPLLSGVVTEIGGIISHGAVVAREYGLPCIVGVKNATRLLKSGDQVLLDGGKGILQKLS